MANNLILRFGLVCWDLLFEKQHQNHHYGELRLGFTYSQFCCKMLVFWWQQGKERETGRPCVL